MKSKTYTRTLEANFTSLMASFHSYIEAAPAEVFVVPWAFNGDKLSDVAIALTAW